MQSIVQRGRLRRRTRTIRAALATLAFWLLLPTAQAQDTVIYVDKTATGAADGSSWADAYTTVQEGIDAAALDGGGEVWVAAGTYDEVRDNDTGSILMEAGVHLYGGFAGTETERTERDWETNETILDGSTAYAGEPAVHVVLGADNVTLDGFTVTGGYAINPEELEGENEGIPDTPPTWIARGSSGGGMLNEGVSPTVSNCTFSGNQSYSESIWVNGGVGAAICNSDYASPTVVDCVFTDNTSVGHYANCAGIASATECSPTITNCLFMDNHGSGILSQANSSTAITDCAFLRNLGAGIWYRRAVSPTVTRCSFAGNSDGIYAWDVVGMLVTDCLFTGQTRNGVTLVDTREDKVWNCTFANNEGVGVEADGYLSEFVNCILWSNHAAQVTRLGSNSTVTYSCIQDGHEGEGNIDAAPLFVDAEGGDYRLTAASPCVDAGTADGAPAIDIDGTERPQRCGVDMGAYELEGEPMACMSLVGSGPTEGFAITVLFVFVALGYPASRRRLLLHTGGCNR